MASTDSAPLGPPIEEAPPPADHVIRPHHIAVLTILMVAFRDMAIKDFPALYALHINRVLLNEVSEVAQPKSHAELMFDLRSGPQSDLPDCYEFQMAIATIHHDLNTVDKMGNFLGNLRCLYKTKNKDVSAAALLQQLRPLFEIRRRNPLNLLLVRSLAFFAADALSLSASYPLLDLIDFAMIIKRADMLIFKTLADRKNWATPDLYEVWEKNLVVGDENLAIENLRCFFEQHFHESNDSGFRPHALLNLVRLHYMNGEFLAARQLLGEAIDTSRLSNDRMTLHHCTSILHRLPPLDEAQKPILHEVQPDLHPFEILFDVSKLLDPVTEQPLSASFIKIFQAIGLYDHWLDVQCAIPIEEQQWAQHAVQSVVWKEAGCNRLADIEENVVLAFTAPGGENSTRMTITLNKAYQTTRQGSYNAALALLIDPSVWRGLIIQDYGTWALAIWDILALRATRRGQLRLHRELLIPRRPNGPFNQKEYIYNIESDKLTTIRESLYQILQLKQHDQATMGIEHLLRALWYSEFLCRFDLYRTAIILLADIGLEFGMTQRSRQILEEIMPQVINGYDIEQRAVACFTLARCIIVAEGSTSDALRQALPYLSQAESDFMALEMYHPLKDVQYMLSVVFHNLDMPVERQAAAQRHSETEMYQEKLEKIVSDPEILEIFDLMEVVGSALTSR